MRSQSDRAKWRQVLRDYSRDNQFTINNRPRADSNKRRNKQINELLESIYDGTYSE